MRLRFIILAQIGCIALVGAAARDMVVLPESYYDLRTYFWLIVFCVSPILCPIFVRREARTKPLPNWKTWSVFLVEASLTLLYFLALLPAVQ